MVTYSRTSTIEKHVGHDCCLKNRVGSEPEGVALENLQKVVGKKGLTLKMPIYLYSVVRKDTAPSLMASWSWLVLSKTYVKYILSILWCMVSSLCRTADTWSRRLLARAPLATHMAPHSRVMMIKSRAKMCNARTRRLCAVQIKTKTFGRQTSSWAMKESKELEWAQCLHDGTQGKPKED